MCQGKLLFFLKNGRNVVWGVTYENPIQVQMRINNKSGEWR